MKIINSSGFAAVFLVISLMFLTMLGSLGAFSAAGSYDDSVTRREYRMTASLAAQSCVSVALLSFAHDYFYAAHDQAVSDFSCTIVSASRIGANISVTASSTYNGITQTVSATATDSGRSIDLISEKNF